MQVRMTTDLSTTHGIVLRKGEVIEVTQQETNAGRQYGVWVGDLFVPLEERWFVLQDKEDL